MRVIVLGGFGNFGARICRRLAQESAVDLVATGRQLRGEKLGRVREALLDLGALSFAKDLAALHPDVVVHCAGPYQGQDYRVAQAAIDCGAHYLDLADGRAFVAGFASALHEQARAAGRTAVTGASTLPALSSAVVDHLLSDLSEIAAIEMVIAPGQRTPRGTATMAAVLGYAGQAFSWWKDGNWQIAHGWQELTRVHLPFGTRWAAACDVPDLELFPAHYAGVKTVTFRAALEVSLQHLVLWMFALTRRAGIRLPLKRWAEPLNQMGSWFDCLGTDCGGMRVDVTGKGPGGSRQRRTWQLTALRNHGPEIPCMAAVLLALKLARGEPLPVGARACLGLLSLSDFEAEFSRWAITTRIEAANL
jgi:Saccharopine dehydrogenase NADP binding domain